MHFFFASRLLCSLLHHGPQRCCSPDTQQNSSVSMQGGVRCVRACVRVCVCVCACVRDRERVSEGMEVQLMNEKLRRWDGDKEVETGCVRVLSLSHACLTTLQHRISQDVDIFSTLSSTSLFSHFNDRASTIFSWSTCHSFIAYSSRSLSGSLTLLTTRHWARCWPLYSQQSTSVTR